VAMQKAPDDEHAHGTQFFVTVKEQSRWNLDIPIFATVSRGQDVVNMLEMGDAIERIELDGNPAPLLARFEHPDPVGLGRGKGVSLLKQEHPRLQVRQGAHRHVDVGVERWILEGLCLVGEAPTEQAHQTIQRSRHGVRD